jgi:hypothetical protein
MEKNTIFGKIVEQLEINKIDTAEVGVDSQVNREML